MDSSSLFLLKKLVAGSTIKKAVEEAIKEVGVDPFSEFKPITILCGEKAGNYPKPSLTPFLNLQLNPVMLF